MKKYKTWERALNGMTGTRFPESIRLVLLDVAGKRLYKSPHWLSFSQMRLFRPPVRLRAGEEGVTLTSDTWSRFQVFNVEQTTETEASINLQRMVFISKNTPALETRNMLCQLFTNEYPHWPASRAQDIAQRLLWVHACDFVKIFERLVPISNGNDREFLIGVAESLVIPPTKEVMMTPSSISVYDLCQNGFIFLDVSRMFDDHGTTTFRERLCHCFFHGILRASSLPGDIVFGSNLDTSAFYCFRFGGTKTIGFVVLSFPLSAETRSELQQHYENFLSQHTHGGEEDRLFVVHAPETSSKETSWHDCYWDEYARAMCPAILSTASSMDILVAHGTLKQVWMALFRTGHGQCERIPVEDDEDWWEDRTRRHRTLKWIHDTTKKLPIVRPIFR